MDAISKPSGSSSLPSLTELSDALEPEDTQGRKVSEISSDASLQQLREKVTRSIVAKPSRAKKLRAVASLPLKEYGQYIKTIGSAKKPGRQRRAIERFVDVLFKAHLTDDTLDGIRKFIDSPLSTPRKLSTDYLSPPRFVHTYDRDAVSGGRLKSESVCLRNSSLKWRASPMVASNEARLAAINAVTDWVYQNFHSFQDKTLTLVSLGSNFLLMEHLIHLELLEMGIPKDKIQWRCIDTIYKRTMVSNTANFRQTPRVMEDFKNNKKECVHFFPTESSYLNKKLDGVNLSTSDKEQGPVALLSFIPHCIDDDSGLKPHHTKGDIFVGTVMKNVDLKYANSICLISADTGRDGSTLLRETFKPASCHSEVNEMVMKAWIGREGTPEISFGYAFRCQSGLVDSATLTFITAFDSVNSEIAPLEKLKYAFEELCINFNLHAIASNHIFPFWDYFVSLNKINQLFFNVGTEDSNDYPVVLCELLLNEVKMMKKTMGVSEAKGATSNSC